MSWLRRLWAWWCPPFPRPDYRLIASLEEQLGYEPSETTWRTVYSPLPFSDAPGQIIHYEPKAPPEWAPSGDLDGDGLIDIILPPTPRSP